MKISSSSESISSSLIPTIELKPAMSALSAVPTTVLGTRMITAVSNSYGARTIGLHDSDVRQSYAVTSKILTETTNNVGTRNDKSPLDTLCSALRDGTSKHVIVKGIDCCPIVF